MWGPHRDGSRPTLFSANREGVVSCVGYLAIYLGGVELGKWLFSGRWVHCPLPSILLPCQPDLELLYVFMTETSCKHMKVVF